MVRETEFYDILKLQPNCSQDDIKKAYRKAAMKHHPDKGGDEKQFVKINAAYEILKDSEKRQTYDQFGKEGLKGHPGLDEDIFGQIFKGFGGGMFQHFGGSFFNNMFSNHQNINRKSPNTMHKHIVTLEQLCERKIVKLKYQRKTLCECYNEEKCSDCNGKGMRVQIIQLGPGMIQQSQSPCNSCKGQGKISKGCSECSKGIILKDTIIQLHLTPDMEEGYVYKFPKQGDHLSNFQEAGDFIVVINTEPHSLFKREGNDLVMEKQLTLKQALTGINFQIKHPSGEDININTEGEIIENNTVLPVAEKGMTLSSFLRIKFSVIFPKTLTNEQINSLRQIL